MRRQLRLQLYVVTGLVLLVFFALQRLSPPSSSALQQKLQLFPLQIETWEGTDDRIDAEVITELKLDDWLMRRYQHPSGAFLWLYIGFLEHQAREKSHHSPLECYPAWGWELVQQGVQQITLSAEEPIVVNKLLVQKGLTRQLILYWYQRGEQLLPETYNAWEAYGDKLSAVLHILLSAPQAGHTLVRVSAPVFESIDVTLAHEIAFIQATFPLLTKHFAGHLASR